jgi:integrase
VADPKPYRRGATWWAGIPQQRGEAVRRSLGTRDERRAGQLCRMLGTLADTGQWAVLHDLATGAATIADTFAAFGAGDLARWRAQRLAAEAAARAAAEAAAHDPDLEPHVARWHAATRAYRPKVADGYYRMVRTLLPEGGRFPRSQLGRRTIREWLDTRTRGTRNRYHVALSSFCAYLVEHEVLEFNVARLVKRIPERPPRLRFLTRGEAQQLVAALPQPHRALHALLLATGADVGGALLVRVRDVDAAARTVRVPGEKRHTRDAVRRLTEAWAGDEFLAFVRAQRALPSAFVFADLLALGRAAGDDPPLARLLDRVERRVLYRLQETCRALGITDYTVKDHRHTYAVQAIRDGYSYAVVAHQLGHGTTQLVHKVYGRFTPDVADYTRRVGIATLADDDARLATG